jgi:preprotein translocase subunit SecD
MRRRPSLLIATLALALLAVTAGCASLTGDGPADTATATDAPTDTAATTDTTATTDTATDGSTGDDSTTDDSTSTETPADDAVVRASLVGVTATDLDLSAADRNRTTAIADALGVDTRDVRMRPAEGTVEVFDDGVSAAELVDALDGQDIDAAAGDVRPGVTRATQSTAVRTLSERFQVLGIEASVETATVDDRRGVAVTPTDGNASRIREAVRDRGTVEIAARFPANETADTAAADAYRDVTLLTNGDFVSVGTVQRPGTGSPAPAVPVTVTDEAAANFSSGLVEFGFTGEGVANCPTDAARADPANATGYCLFTVHDGDVVYAAGMSAGLADQIESGEWAADPQFVMTATNESEAQELRAHLVAGALPTRLSVAD